MNITGDTRFLIISRCIGGIVTLIAIYFVLTNTLGFNNIKNQNIDLFTAMIFGIIIVLVIIIILSIRSIIKEKQNMELTPNYYSQQTVNSEYLPCPRCGSNNLEKVENSWRSGFLGQRLENQVRCKSCGWSNRKIYNK